MADEHPIITWQLFGGSDVVTGKVVLCLHNRTGDELCHSSHSNSQWFTAPEDTGRMFITGNETSPATNCSCGPGQCTWGIWRKRILILPCFTVWLDFWFPEKKLLENLSFHYCSLPRISNHLLSGTGIRTLGDFSLPFLLQALWRGFLTSPITLLCRISALPPSWLLFFLSWLLKQRGFWSFIHWSHRGRTSTVS